MGNSAPPFLSQSYLQYLESTFLQAFFYVLQQTWRDYIIFATLGLMSELIKLFSRHQDSDLAGILTKFEILLLVGAVVWFVYHFARYVIPKIFF